MDAEHNLVCAVLATGSVTELGAARISADQLVGLPHKLVLDKILTHHTKYGVVPAQDTLADWIAREFPERGLPEYEFIAPSEPIDVYLDQVREQHRGRVMNDGLLQVIIAFEKGDLDGAQALMAATAGKCAQALPRAAALNLSADVEERLARYASFRDLDQGLRGIPSGFASLDKATLGFQRGQLIPITALPKRGKTTIISTMALNAHRYGIEHGQRIVPLVYGFEMPAADIAERLDASIAGLSSTKLRAGELDAFEWARLERSIRAMEGQHPFILETGIGSVTTITEIAAKLDEHKPDILFVDGIYMMIDEITGKVATEWQAMTNITRAFKRLAQRYDIPIIITSQNRASKIGKNGADMHSTGYASSFAEDGDLNLALEDTDDDRIKKMTVVASRNTGGLSFWIEWNWSKGSFTELAEDPFMAGSETAHAAW